MTSRPWKRRERTGPTASAMGAVVLALGLIGAPGAAGASTWCDPDVDPACWDGSSDGYADPYGTTWYDDGSWDTYEDPSGTTWYDDGSWDTYEDPNGTTWYEDGSWESYEGPGSTIWYDDGGVDAGPANGAALPPALLAMIDRGDLSGDGAERFDPGSLPLAEATRLGAARLVLGIDALAELGAFRRDPDPAINDAVRQIRDRIAPDGLDADGYRAEISVLADDLGELVEILDEAGTLGDPLIQVEGALADGALLDELDQGSTGLYDPNDWLSAAADLLLRSGAEPVFDDQRDGDLPAVLGLAARLSGPTGVAPEAGAEPVATTSPPASSTTSLAQSAPVVETGAAEERDQAAGSGLLWLVAVALALLAAVAGAAVVWRRSTRSRLAAPAQGPSPAGVSTGPASIGANPVAPTTSGSNASLEDLLEVSRRMTSSLDTTEVAEIALAEAERLVGAEGGLLAVRSEQGLQTLCHRPTALFDLESLDRGALRRVLDTGRSIVQVTDDEPSLVEVPMALAAIPIVAEGTVAGAILVVRVPTEPFARQELDGLEMLAPLIGSALLAAQTHGSAAKLADLDPLSGLNNRRRLTADLAVGADRPLGAIMVDIDHFKNFNDTNGHAAGDEALRRVGQLLADNVRSGDVVYRYGGEEFCILLPDASPDEAAAVAERVRAAVEAADIPGGENQPAGRVTISVGVARCEPGAHLGVIEAADAALYQAKHGGRNQVCTDWA